MNHDDWHKQVRKFNNLERFIFGTVGVFMIMLVILFGLALIWLAKLVF